MGDSITDFWNLEQYFPGKPYVNRGIGGQTTPQMLVRMYPDVIELKPAAMVVLAGTNDIARNTGPETAEMIQQNILAMTELAQHHGIKVVLSSVLPVSDYPFLRVAERAAGNSGYGQGWPSASCREDDGQSSRGRHPEAECLDEGLRRESGCRLCGLLQPVDRAGLAERRIFRRTVYIPMPRVQGNGRNRGGSDPESTTPAASNN